MSDDLVGRLNYTHEHGIFDAQVAGMLASPKEAATRITQLEAEIEWLRRTAIDIAASLTAAISLLEKGGKAAKKAAASDRMFDQMLDDYRNSLERARAALRAGDGR